jgi:hypothetical protein
MRILFVNIATKHPYIPNTYNISTTHFLNIDNDRLWTKHLTAGGNAAVVVVVWSVDTQATAGEGPPDGALVGASITVDISLEPGVASRNNWKQNLALIMILMMSNAQVGLQGWSLSASRKRWRNTTLPAVPEASVFAVADHPRAVTRAAYTLWSMLAQTSPIPSRIIRIIEHRFKNYGEYLLWTSFKVWMLE